MSRTKSGTRVGTWLPFGFVATLVFVAACARPVAPLPDLPRPDPTPAPTLVLPADAGPHDALTEWWYYTGHLHSDDGRQYGFEFTVFQVRRQGAPTGYLAHFAISDIEGQRFSHQSRFRQGDPFSAVPFDVDGWRLRTDGNADVIEATMASGPGADVPFGVQLSLMDEKPPALHHGGYIEYGPAGGSYYSSRTRLAVSCSSTTAPSSCSMCCGARTARRPASTAHRSWPMAASTTCNPAASALSQQAAGRARIPAPSTPQAGASNCPPASTLS